MLEGIGWWTFDAETQTLVNSVSDQRRAESTLMRGVSLPSSTGITAAGSSGAP